MRKKQTQKPVISKKEQTVPTSPNTNKNDNDSSSLSSEEEEKENNLDKARHDKRKKYEEIKQMKATIPLDVLCRKLPPEFEEFLTYTRSLRYAECPDYAKCRSLFTNLYEKQGYKYDNLFDWQDKSLIQKNKELKQRELKKRMAKLEKMKNIDEIEGEDDPETLTRDASVSRKKSQNRSRQPKHVSHKILSDEKLEIDDEK